MILKIILIGFAILIGLAVLGTFIELGRAKFPPRQPRMRVRKIEHGEEKIIGDGAWKTVQGEYPRGKYSRQSARVRDIEPRGA